MVEAWVSSVRYEEHWEGVAGRGRVVMQLTMIVKFIKRGKFTI